MPVKVMSKLGLAAAIAPLTFFALSNRAAEAALIGDTITVSIGPPGNPTAISRPNLVVIDPGIEFSEGSIEADVKNASFDLIYTVVSSGIDPTEWLLSDLNWVDIPTGMITGVIQTDGPVVNNLSFTPDSISVSVPGVSPGVTTFSFDIQTDMQASSFLKSVQFLGYWH